MGKVKAWIMDLEDEFIDKCSEIALESECYMEYCERAVLHDDLVKHLDEYEVNGLMEHAWNEAWDKYQ